MWLPMSAWVMLHDAKIDVPKNPEITIYFYVVSFIKIKGL